MSVKSTDKSVFTKSKRTASAVLTNTPLLRFYSYATLAHLVGYSQLAPPRPKSNNDEFRSVWRRHRMLREEALCV